MREKRDKAVFGTISLYPDQWAIAREHAGTLPLGNRAMPSTSAALQDIINIFRDSKLNEQNTE